MKLFPTVRLVLLPLLALAIFNLGGNHSQTQSIRVQNYADGELLVKFQPDYSKDRGGQFGTERIRDFSAVGWQHVRLPRGMSVSEGLARYRSLPGVKDAQPNFVYRVQASANDPRFGELYGLQKIQAPTVWDTTIGSASVVVAVIDLGVDYNHEDLSANIWRNPGETGLDPLGADKSSNAIDDDDNGYVDDVYGIDTINHDSNPIDDAGHGTHVSGTIGAVGNNSKGVVGVNWTVRIMAIKSHNSAGNGTSASVVEAFQYAAMMRQRGINVRVTNSSWGGAPEAPAYDQALKDAIDAAGNVGILNVCAAGNGNNDNDANPFYPASYDSPSIISVAASDQGDNRAGFSSYGATTVDLAAPGVGILSTYRGSYGFLSGTSMSTPHVSGAAALLCAAAPYLSLSELKATLLNSVDVLPQWAGLIQTGGRLNIARAVQSLPTTNRIDSTDFFVRQHYLDFLGREPDAPGQAYWTNEIAQCGNDPVCIEIKRINVSAAFFLSIEFQNTSYLVDRFYLASFGRRPRFAEFQPDRQLVSQGLVVNLPGWEQQLESNKRSFADAWVNRQAFKTIYDSKTNEQYVKALFANAGVVPSQASQDALIAGLNSGAETRATVLRKVADDETFYRQELNPAFVLMEYFGYLRRDPDEPGYQFWLQKLNQFGGNYVNAEMVKAFLTSTEYRLRFGPP